MRTGPPSSSAVKVLQLRGARSERAGCLARVLRGHVFWPESRVSICLRRGSSGDAVAALSVLLAGGAQVPSSRTTRRRRRAMVLRRAGVTVSVVDDDGRAPLDGRVPTLVEAARAPPRDPTANLAIAPPGPGGLRPLHVSLHRPTQGSRPVEHGAWPTLWARSPPGWHR